MAEEVYKNLFEKGGDGKFEELFEFSRNEDKFKILNEKMKQYSQKKLKSTVIRNIPDLKKDLKVYSDNVMRGIRTERKINIAERVIVTKPFASVVISPNFPYCLKCHKLNVHFLRCEGCKIVFYCSSDCYHADQTHLYECGTFFHAIENQYIKCCIQMVLESMSAFENYNDLIGAAIEAKLQTDSNIFKRIYDRESQFKCVMKLQTQRYNQSQHQKINQSRESVKLAFEYCMEFQHIRAYFNKESDETDDVEMDEEGATNDEEMDGCIDDEMKVAEGSKLSNGEIFLQHLISHFIGVININTFEKNLGHGKTKTKKGTAMYIYDILSLINHSCAPNLMNFFDDNTMICIANQNIEKGSQLYMSYVDVEELKLKKKLRRLELQDRFGFLCNCDRCKQNVEPTANQFNDANKVTMAEMETKITGNATTLSDKIAYLFAYHDRLLKRN